MKSCLWKTDSEIAKINESHEDKNGIQFLIFVINGLISVSPINTCINMKLMILYTPTLIDIYKKLIQKYQNFESRKNSWK